MNVKLSRKEILALLLIGICVIFTPIILTRDAIFGISFLGTGDIGDTIGGITAPITSLIGSILVYYALKAQIDANKIIQNQFLISHATDIIYKQLERFENAVSLFKVKDGGFELRGLEAFIFLDPRPIAITYTLKDLDEAQLKEVEKKNCECLKKYLQYSKEIEVFASSIHSNIQTLKGYFLHNDLKAKQLNELKKVFFRNIGYHTLAAIADISDTLFEYLDLKNTDCDIDFESLFLPSSHLRNVKKFWEVQINESNIESLRKKWAEELGENTPGIIPV